MVPGDLLDQISHQCRRLERSHSGLTTSLSPPSPFLPFTDEGWGLSMRQLGGTFAQLVSVSLLSLCAWASAGSWAITLGFLGHVLH